jgi:hypothetical protein
MDIPTNIPSEATPDELHSLADQFSDYCIVQRQWLKSGAFGNPGENEKESPQYQAVRHRAQHAAEAAEAIRKLAAWKPQ